jgi:hypothetical protein
VGGNTRGSATIAATAPFQGDDVRANHQAMGVPITKRSNVTTLANFKVSQMAAKSDEFIE